MPTYQYHCTHCDTEFEEFQKMTDPALEHCPHCSKKPTRLISSGAGVIFKGSGFYITDYKKSGGKSESDKSESTKSETLKSESKPTSGGGSSTSKE